MTMQFAQPQATGMFFKPADHSDHLILVTAVHETYDRYDDLAGKDKLNARFDYVDLDSDDGLVENAISSHPGIALRLKGSVGKGTPVLGRIGQEASKKAGFNAAWVLGEFTEGVDDKRAADWLTANATASVRQPEATPQPPAEAAAAQKPTAATTIPASVAETMKANGIQIPAGAQIVPG